MIVDPDAPPYSKAARDYLIRTYALIELDDPITMLLHDYTAEDVALAFDAGRQSKKEKKSK